MYIQRWILRKVVVYLFSARRSCRHVSTHKIKIHSRQLASSCEQFYASFWRHWEVPLWLCWSVTLWLAQSVNTLESTSLLARGGQQFNLIKTSWCVSSISIDKDFDRGRDGATTDSGCGVRAISKRWWIRWRCICYLLHTKEQGQGVQHERTGP